MTAAIILIVLAVWVLYAGWRFYRQVNWNEPPGVTEDLAELRRREAELLHIEEFLLDAQSQGKLSAPCVQEFQRFSEQERRAMRAAAQPEKR